MYTLDVPHPRATVEDGPDGIEIVAPAPRMWPVVGFLALWLAGWATGETFAVRAVARGVPAAAGAFLVVWLVFWTWGGLVAGTSVLWMLWGRERLRLAPDALVLRRDVLGVGFAKRYPIDLVTHLEVAEPPAPPPGAQRDPQAAEKAMRLARALGLRGPGLTFLASGRPVRFGAALDPDEARQVVALLRSRHSFADADRAA